MNVALHRPIPSSRHEHKQCCYPAQALVVNPLGIGDVFEFKAMRSSQGPTSYDLSYQLPVGGAVDFPLSFHARKVGNGVKW